MGNLQKCSLFIHRQQSERVLVYHPEFFHLSWQQHKQRIKKKKLYKLFSLRNVDN